MGREMHNHVTTLPVTRKSFNRCNLFFSSCLLLTSHNLEKLFEVSNRHWHSVSLRYMNKGTFHVCTSDFITEQVHVACCVTTQQWKKLREKEGSIYP